MSAGFRAVQWNRAKLVYDGILLAGVALYIGAYLTLVYWLDPPKDLPACDRSMHPRFRHLRLLHADDDPLDRAAGAARSPLPAAAVQPAPFRRADLLRRAPARFLHGRMVRGPKRAAEPLRRTDQSLRLRQVHRLSLQGAGPRRAPHPVPDGGDQPRLLACLPHAAGLEGVCTWRFTSPMGSS